MGARLRLKASRDISGFTLPVRRIFRAMQKCATGLALALEPSVAIDSDYSGFIL